MNKYLLTGLLLTTALVSVSQIGRLQGRIQELEETPGTDQELMLRVARQLHEVRAALDATRQQLEKDEARRVLESRLGSLETRVVESDSELAQQNERLADWERVWRGKAPDDFEQRLGDLRVSLERRWKEIDDLTTSTASLAQKDREKLLEIEGDLKPLVARDTGSMWHDLVGPIVQLAGESTVGSGVLLESIPREREAGYDTYLLTSWHVVRDIYGSPDRTDQPVPVKMYNENGRTTQEFARMIVYDVSLDAALLVLMTDRQVPCGARLASRERLARTRIFDRVYAVGCPLGNDPIPTGGEVAATHHEIDGATYWMISAPTYIGNSGGGIYDAESRELIGIFSKIYTHGSMRSTIVPHMGLVTPLSRIYDWLERSGQGRVANAQSLRQGQPQMAAAQR